MIREFLAPRIDGYFRRKLVEIKIDTNSFRRERESIFRERSLEEIHSDFMASAARSDRVVRIARFVERRLGITLDLGTFEDRMRNLSVSKPPETIRQEP